mmetsp:Transcript_9666/g.28527  ORF Transcript_9666/g.28527 Transcript_9666/m.28527 type:complete len:821 (-) Transcript_9666:30-2492(-)
MLQRCASALERGTWHAVVLAACVICGAGATQDDACSALSGPGAQVRIDSERVAVGNGYACAVFELAKPRLSTLRGDFAGAGRYGASALAEGQLELEDASGKVFASADAGPATATVLSSAREEVAVEIRGLRDRAEAPMVEEVWTMSLAAGARSVVLKISGRSARAGQVRAVRHSFRLLPSSIYALFDGGVVQMKDQDDGKNYYFSKDGLARLYALGADAEKAGDLSIAVRRESAGDIALVSGRQAPRSGFQDIAIASAELGPMDSWSKGWDGAPAVAVPEGREWKVVLHLAPNDHDFPAQGPEGDLPAGGNIPAADLQAFLTGVYGSPVGQLCTHDGGVKQGVRVAQMATSIGSPSHGYDGLYNFFDPDNFLSTAALLYSGDEYLQAQVRAVLERNGDVMKDGGQLPHHFVGLDPTYSALSGETQTGPNVFWILSCFNYAKTTGDLAWLRNYMPKLRKASSFLFDMIDNRTGLLNSPGSLMIDVFIRHGFTSDTNAMVVGFLREFASAERAVGNATGAEHMDATADGIASAINKLLWGTDHYISYRTPDGSTRDLVDYDSNLIALAHGIASPERARATLARIDSGRCTHGRATFVSEQYYGPKDTTGGNTGDSWCSMGRIGWFDALARKRYGDQHTFDSLLLDPLIGDVNRWTWLHERYNCDGSPQTNRTEYYFEYPSVTAMMIHYVRYGIQLDFEGVTVSPFGPEAFAYHVGNVHVDYSRDRVALSVPGSGARRVAVEGLRPGAGYLATAAPRAPPRGEGAAARPLASPECLVEGPKDKPLVGDRNGRVEFVATVGDQNGRCEILLVRSSNGDGTAVFL